MNSRVVVPALPLTAGAGLPAPPLNSVQFNSPLGTFSGNSHLRFTRAANVDTLFVGYDGVVGDTGVIVLGNPNLNTLTIKPKPTQVVNWNFIWPINHGTGGHPAMIDSLNTGDVSWIDLDTIYAPIGSGAPSGPVNGVQYDNAGAFGADSAFLYLPGLGSLKLGDYSGGLAVAGQIVFPDPASVAFSVNLLAPVGIAGTIAVTLFTRLPPGSNYATILNAAGQLDYYAARSIAAIDSDAALALVTANTAAAQATALIALVGGPATTGLNGTISWIGAVADPHSLFVVNGIIQNTSF